MVGNTPHPEHLARPHLAPGEIREKEPTMTRKGFATADAAIGQAEAERHTSRTRTKVYELYPREPGPASASP